MALVETLEKVWNVWNIRGFLILSLSLQVFLIVAAPFRKKTSNGFVLFLIWSAYLLADWAAIFGLGLMLNDLRYQSSAYADKAALLALWAPFLLLHLGGPDTITAFALEDNALWPRHVVGLAAQLSSSIYIFILSNIPKNPLLYPTILVLLAGFFKYAERSWAFYRASLDHFKESVLKEDEAESKVTTGSGETIGYTSPETWDDVFDEIDGPARVSAWTSRSSSSKNALDETELVRHAYDFFNQKMGIKGLVVDVVRYSSRWDSGRKIFQERIGAEDALRVILVELNFLYDLLYTKVIILTSISGCVIRVSSFAVVMTALILFIFIDKHDVFHNNITDLIITYVLLLGAIALDTIALLMLIFSDWSVARTTWLDSPVLRRIHTAVVNRRKPMLRLYQPSDNVTIAMFESNLLFRRWSESLSGYSLISYCRGEYSRLAGPNPQLISMGDVFSKLHIPQCLCLYESKMHFGYDLWNLIFSELQENSSRVGGVRDSGVYCEGRGKGILHEIVDEDHRRMLEDRVGDSIAYDKCILMWHVATDLLFHHTVGVDTHDNEEQKHMVLCKIISDYMLYLMVMQPSMMSVVAGIFSLRFQHTCGELRTEWLTSHMFELYEAQRRGVMIKETCDYYIADRGGVETDNQGRKSVLGEAVRTAKALKVIWVEKKWRMLCRLWVEMLVYAAVHVRPDMHARTLNRGGELITLVWLLAAHLGLGIPIE